MHWACYPSDNILNLYSGGTMLKSQPIYRTEFSIKENWKQIWKNEIKDTVIWSWMEQVHIMNGSSISNSWLKYGVRILTNPVYTRTIFIEQWSPKKQYYYMFCEIQVSISLTCCYGDFCQTFVIPFNILQGRWVEMEPQNMSYIWGGSLQNLCYQEVFHLFWS